MATLIKDTVRGNCHDCGAAPGELHELGCDTERCPRCGMQLISCSCFTKYDIETGDQTWDTEGLNRDGRIPWTGIMYEREMKYCEQHDHWTKFTDGQWQKVSRDDPDAIHDINTAVIKLHIDGEKD